MTYMSDVLLLGRLTRRRLRRLMQSYRYGASALEKSPIFFANSFPKSGTHLLTQVLDGFTRLGPAVNSGLPAVITFRGDTGERRGQKEITRDLQRLLPGDIAYGHLYASPENVGFLCSEQVAAYFILRDPRDVVVSHAHYLAQMAPGHIHHAYYKTNLDNFDERIRASIVGINNTTNDDGGNNGFGAGFPNILERFKPYMGWLVKAEILILHFEDFVIHPLDTIGRVLTHASKRGYLPKYPHSECIQIIAQGIDPKRSPTFRRGNVGGWRTGFNEENKRLFKEIAGDMLVQLGYEKNLDW